MFYASKRACLITATTTTTTNIRLKAVNISSSSEGAAIPLLTAA